MTITHSLDFSRHSDCVPSIQNERERLTRYAFPRSLSHSTLIILSENLQASICPPMERSRHALRSIQTPKFGSLLYLILPLDVSSLSRQFTFNTIWCEQLDLNSQFRMYLSISLSHCSSNPLRADFQTWKTPQQPRSFSIRSGPHTIRANFPSSSITDSVLEFPPKITRPNHQACSQPKTHRSRRCNKRHRWDHAFLPDSTISSIPIVLSPTSHLPHLQCKLPSIWHST